MAVKQGEYAPEWASEELKADKEGVLEAVKQTSVRLITPRRSTRRTMWWSSRQ